MRVFNSKCLVIANLTSGWRKFPIQQLDWLQVTKEIKRKQSMYLCWILSGLCKDFITQIQQAWEQEYLLPHSTAFLFTCCFAFWQQRVFKISFLGQCLSNVFIYNSEKEETFFSAEWNARRTFFLGIMTECCRYFYGAMMPECNFYSQFKLENNVSLQN